MADSVHELNKELMSELRAQGNRHAEEIKSLAAKVEENTEVVRNCMMNLVEFSAERSNLTRCLMEVKEEQRSLNKMAHAADRKLVELDTRWNMVRVLFGLNLGIVTIGVSCIALL